MKKANSTSRGFSLIEVSAALGIVSVALVSLLAVVPMGLSNTRACKSETHAAELAKAVFSTLATEPLKKTQCFSREEPLDLSVLENADENSPATTLYASYDVRRDFPTIMRAETLPDEMANDAEVYRIELRNSPQRFSDADATVVGTQMKIAVYLGRERNPIFRATTFLGTYGKAGLLEQTQP